MPVTRIAYREFGRDPDLSFDRYRAIPGKEILGEVATRRAIDDLLETQAALATDRTWCQPSPVVSPDRVRAMAAQGELTPQKRAEYRSALQRPREIEGRHREPKSDGEQELHRMARWIIDQWRGVDNRLDDPGR